MGGGHRRGWHRWAGLIGVGAGFFASAGCTSGGDGGTAAPSAAPTSAASTAATGSGCDDLSPVAGYPPQESGRFNEVHGTGHDAELWGLIFAEVPLIAGKETKIVWRMTGSGPMRVTARQADGTAARLTWGPEEHGSSSYDRPGEEWGTGLVFPKAGCWQVHLRRTAGSADVWLMVR